MKQVKRGTFQTKLLAGCIAIVLCVGGLLLLSNQIVKYAAEQQLSVREKTVRPLAAVNSLQTQLYKVQVIEFGLVQKKDFFALSAEIDRLQQQSKVFGQQLNALSELLPEKNFSSVPNIQKHWVLLQESLDQVMQAAASMQLQQVQDISTYQAQPRFDTIVFELDKLAGAIEQASAATYAESLKKLDKQRQNFFVAFFGGCRFRHVGADVICPLFIKTSQSFA